MILAHQEIMVIKLSFVFPLLSSVLAASVLLAQETQTVTLDRKLQIPGAVLKPGEYTFTVEDRLADRAIIRITEAKKNLHELVLAVPNDKLNQGEHNKLILFSAPNSNKQILQGWMCPSCQTALEVVYPKNDAVKITVETAKAVMAVDPAYDKLPKNLSPDDMKVVTLWLLSPKEVTPTQRGKGIEAAKYTDLKKQDLQTASVPASPPVKTATPEDTAKGVERSSTPTSNTEPATNNSVATESATDSTAASSSASVSTDALTNSTASNVTTAAPQPSVSKNLHARTPMASVRHMPHTASDTYNLGLAGLVLLILGLGSYLQRQFFPGLLGVKE